MRSGKAALWTGRVISTLVVLLFLMGVVMSFAKPDMVKEGMAHTGYPHHLATPLAIVELACVIVYVIPQTAILGAILLTGYLGGATATHVRIQEPWFLPVIVGVLVWLGLYFREPRLRALVPLRKP